MKSMLLAVILFCAVSFSFAQMDMMQMYLLSQMGNRGRSGSTGATPSGSGTGYPASRNAIGTMGAGAAGSTAGSSSPLGGLLGGGNRGMNMFAASGFLGDFFQDMSMCQMMPPRMRGFCYMRTFGM